MADLKPELQNSFLLPALEIKVDLNSFESVYSVGYSTGTTAGYGTSVSTHSVVGFGSVQSSINRDPRVQDAITIFERDVKNNITNPIGEKKGYITCRIANGSAKAGCFGFSILSGFTLMIPNLLGMPFGCNKTYLDVEVEIYDLKNNLIGRYNAQGYDKTWVAMYYGYSDFGPDKSAKPVARISSINAFKSAMNEIKRQIENDYSRVKAKLNNYDRIAIVNPKIIQKWSRGCKKPL